MKRKYLIPASLALAASAALLGACKAADTATTATAPSAGATQAAGKSAATGTTEIHADGVRRVGPAELKQMLDEGRAVVYDTRGKGSYDYERIKGALSMPHEEVANRVGEFPRDKTLVFYCTWPNEHTSAGAALTLKSKGIEDTAALLGGMGAWKNAGLQTEGTGVKWK